MEAVNEGLGALRGLEPRLGSSHEGLGSQTVLEDTRWTGLN